MAKRGRPAKEVIETSVEQNIIHRKKGKLIEPGILLLLKDKPSHGYDLTNKLADMDINEECIEAVVVYRTLRDMEKQELINSRWDTEGPGTARRVYEVTTAANAEVDKWSRGIEEEIGLLENLLKKITEFVPK